MIGVSSVHCGINCYCAPCTWREVSWLCTRNMGIGHSTWYSVRVSLIIHYEKLPNGIFLIIAFCFLHPAFLSYTASAIVVTLFLVLYCTPRYGQTNILVYTGICSIIGSFTVSDSTQLTLSFLIFLSFWIFLYFLAVNWVVYHSPPYVLTFW